MLPGAMRSGEKRNRPARTRRNAFGDRIANAGRGIRYRKFGKELLLLPGLGSRLTRHGIGRTKPVASIDHLHALHPRFKDGVGVPAFRVWKPIASGPAMTIVSRRSRSGRALKRG